MSSENRAAAAFFLSLFLLLLGIFTLLYGLLEVAFLLFYFFTFTLGLAVSWWLKHRRRLV